MDIETLVKPGIREIQRYEPGETRPDSIKLSSNENPRGPAAEIVAAVTEAMRSANRYPESGVPRLTRALAERHGLGEDRVMVGNGSNEIIDLLVRAFVAEDENVVFPWPSFIVYNLIPKVCGVEPRPVLLKDYRMDVAAMMDAVDDKTRMVFVCNPNNPTSTYSTAREVDTLVNSLREDVLVVMDEAYVDYVTADDYPDSLAMMKRRNTIITLRTFSKFYAIAGVRLGYAIADPVVIQTLHRTRQPFNVSSIAESAGLAAVACSDKLTPLVGETIRERERVRAVARRLGMECPPSQTNFVFVDLLDSGVDLYEELGRRGVVVRRMGQFGSATNTYRISIGTPEENDRLIDALESVFR